MKTKKQHYIFRKYLKPWASSDELIWCFRDDKIFHSNLMGVGQSRYFYKLNELTPKDIEGIRNLTINRATPYLQNLHENLLSLFTNIFSLKKMIDIQGIKNAEIEEKLDEEIHNLEENLHSKIEQDGIKYIDLLLNEDVSFSRNQDDFMTFVHFMCVQYVRTKKLQDTMFELLKGNNIVNIENSWGVLRHIFATTIAWNIVNKNTFKIILLKNISSIPFITGDQPIINIHPINKENQEVSELELYFPISPNLAILLSKKSEYSEYNQKNINQSEVETYNKFVIDSFHEQVYSNSKEILEKYFNKE